MNYLETDLIGYNCQNPHSCNMTHICLYLRFGDTEFDYETIYKAVVTHEGHDCTSPNYYCSYITSGSNPTAMGCYLPWNDEDCHYIRSVCLTTYGG